MPRPRKTAPAAVAFTPPASTSATSDPFASLADPTVVPTARPDSQPVDVDTEIPPSLRNRVDSAYQAYKAGDEQWRYQAVADEQVKNAIIAAMKLYGRWRKAGRVTIATRDEVDGFRYKARDYSPRGVGGNAA